MLLLRVKQTLLPLLVALSACSSSPPADSTPPLPGQLTIESNGPVVAAKDRVKNADPREERLARTIAYLLKEQHVRDQEINDALSQKSFHSFVEGMDPDKLFLLAEDLTLFKKSQNLLDDEMLSGNLKLAHLASSRFAQRLTRVSTIVAGLLAGSFSFEAEEWRETDSDKLDYAKDDAALKERWRKLLKLEVLGRVSRMAARVESIEKLLAEIQAEASKKKPTKEQLEAREKKVASLNRALAKIPKTVPERIKKAQSDSATSYSARFVRLSDEDALAPAAGFINAIAHNFDPHTTYMPPTEKENFDIQMSGTLEGIGAVLVERDHFIAVSDVVPGGASWRQGDLESGDLILSVMQEDAEAIDIGDMKINRVVKMIRGPKDTIVTLTVEKDDGSIKTIEITRDKVELEAAYAQGATLKLPGGQEVGYIYLPSFYGDTRGHDPNARTSAKDVKALLNVFSKRKLSGVVIDVRSNGGGLLDDSRKMAGFFIEDGPIVQTLLPDGTLEVLSDTDPSVVYGGKVIVLIDRFSASASEILAAALQDYGRALVVGPGPTHGKGTVQALLDLNRANTSPNDPPMGVLKLTIQQFFRINGGSTQQRGVTPDIPFPDSFKHLKTGERNLDNALPWTSVDKQPFRAWPKSWDAATLLAKSESRQAKSRYFTSMEKRGELMKKRQDETRIPLKRSAYEARITAQDAEFDALMGKDAKKRKNLFAASHIKYSKHAKVIPRKKGGKDKNQLWIDSLRKDFVLEETLRILSEM